MDRNQHTLLYPLDGVSALTRARTVRQMDELSSRTKSHLKTTDVVDPKTKTAKLLRHTGKTGRKALNALASGNRKAADALLRAADDVLTHRAMLRAWKNGDIDTRELASGLRHYDELDNSEKGIADDVIASTGDDGARLMADGGLSAVNRIYQLDLDVNKNGLASNLARMHSDYGFGVERIRQTVADLETLEGTDGIDELARSLNSPEPSDFRGHRFEARYAAENSDDVIRLQADNTVSSRPGDIDVVTKENGQRIGVEVKNRDFEQWSFETFKGDISQINKGFGKLAKSDGSPIDDGKFVFGRDPPERFRNYLHKNDINYEVRTDLKR